MACTRSMEFRIEIEALVLDDFFGLGEPRLEALREQFDIVGDRFERIVDLVGEADRDFAGGGELLRVAQPPNVAGEADRADFMALGVVDERAGDHDRDEFAGLVAEDSVSKPAIRPASSDSRIAFITRRASSIDG